MGCVLIIASEGVFVWMYLNLFLTDRSLIGFWLCFDAYCDGVLVCLGE